MQKTVILALFLASFSSLAQASEQLGEVGLADFLVEPSFYFAERNPTTGQTDSGFSLGNTYVAAQWILQKSISGRLQFASYDLMNRPSWSPSTETGLGFVEAYAEMDMGLGSLRAGLVPLSFGLDGSTSETQTWFPRHKIYSEHVLGLRDYGMTYSINNKEFFTDVAIHNGEGGRDQDRRFWQTARWGWRGGAGIQVGLSGTVGYYKLPTSYDTKTRVGNFFFGMDLYAIGIAAEATLGERKSSLAQNQFFDWYVAFRHSLGRNWGFLARYESFDPSSRVASDAQHQGMGGIYIQNETNTSRVEAFYMKNWEEDTQTANDEVRVIWRLTSAYKK